MDKYFVSVGSQYMSNDLNKVLQLTSTFYQMVVNTCLMILICHVDNTFHMVAFGGPSHEIIIDGVWYELLFSGPPREITAGNHKLLVGLPTPAPDVKILDPIENQKLKDSDIDSIKN